MKKGFTLVEILLALSVVAIFMAAVFFTFSRLHIKYLVYRQINDDKALISGIHNFYRESLGEQNTNKYSTINDSLLVKAGIYPQSMLKKVQHFPGQYTTDTYNIFKGGVAITASGFVDNYGHSSMVLFDYNSMISKEACVEYVLSFYNNFKNDGLLYIIVNSNRFYFSYRYQEILGTPSSQKNKSKNEIYKEKLNSFCQGDENIGFVAEFE